MDCAHPYSLGMMIARDMVNVDFGILSRVIVLETKLDVDPMVHDQCDDNGVALYMQ
jgi:hypothetical protein